MKLNPLKTAAIAGALALAATHAAAAPITWATWTSNTNATAGAVNITYSGQLLGLDIDAANWQPATTWADGSVINNAPLAGSALVVLTGGTNTGTNTITFSQTVVDPVFAIWSLGQPGNTPNFTFSATPTFVAGGPSAEYGGPAIGVAGNVVSGTEGNGSVIFYGSFNSISWTNPIFENYYGFTVGISGVETSVVPVPAAVWLFGTGLMALVGISRRKRAAA